MVSDKKGGLSITVIIELVIGIVVLFGIIAAFIYPIIEVGKPISPFACPINEPITAKGCFCEGERIPGPGYCCEGEGYSKEPCFPITNK